MSSSTRKSAIVTPGSYVDVFHLAVSIKKVPRNYILHLHFDTIEPDFVRFSDSLRA